MEKIRKIIEFVLHCMKAEFYLDI